MKKNKKCQSKQKIPRFNAILMYQSAIDPEKGSVRPEKGHKFMFCWYDYKRWPGDADLLPMTGKIPQEGEQPKTGAAGTW